MLSTSARTRTVRFRTYGEPADVLSLEEDEAPVPGPGQIRVRVVACGINPADWALCRGLFPGRLPRGIGLEVAGTVEALGEDAAAAEDIAVGDPVLGTPDWAHLPSAGAADLAVLEHWARIPDGLDFRQAAALPMAVVTAHGSLDVLGVRCDPVDGEVESRQTVLVHGAGTTVGFAAVQIALRRGAQVIATAGLSYADQLGAFGAQVTRYGVGMVGRVLDLAGAPVDLVLDAAPVSDVLPDLVRCAGGAANHVVTVSDHAAAPALGVRSNLGGGAPPYHVLSDYAELAARGNFSIPIARTYGLSDWRSALEASLSGRAGGKLLLIPDTRQ